MYQPHSLSYLLSPYNTFLLEKRTVPWLLKIFLAPYGNRGHRSPILVSITYQINRVCALSAQFFKSRLNNILPSTSRSAKWSLTPDISLQITAVWCRLTIRVMCRVCGRLKRTVACGAFPWRGKRNTHRGYFRDILHLSGKVPHLNYGTHLIAIMLFHGTFDQFVHFIPFIFEILRGHDRELLLICGCFLQSRDEHYICFLFWSGLVLPSHSLHCNPSPCTVLSSAVLLIRGWKFV